MKIAFCSDISQFHQDRLRDRDWSQRFLGSAWVTSLYERSAELGIELTSGDVALQKIADGLWNASEVHVVQEMDAHHGLELCRLGAIPAVMLMLESPLIAYRSVDRLIRSCPRFAHCIGPTAVFESIPALHDATLWPLAFPSYWRNRFPPVKPWSGRKPAVLVAANKYWRERKLVRARSLKDVLRVWRHWLRKRFSTTYQACAPLQLHDARIDLLHTLGKRHMVEIYGRGWENTDNMPAMQAARMNEIRSTFCGLCDDKHELLSNYRFTIAYENTAYPGYVTEKVIDALVASSIPVYLGAPDITSQLPAAAFIDARNFGSPQEIAEYMESMTEAKAGEMIEAGREFLHSGAGQRYSYEGFGEWIFSLAGGKTDNT